MKHQKQTLYALNADSRKKPLVEGIAALCLFALWTAAVSLIDVRAIGPNGSTVGFAALNGRIHDLTGVHMTSYILTIGSALYRSRLCSALRFSVLPNG